MIQLEPYNKRPNRDEILKTYLTLLDKALPFFKEDLFVLAIEKFNLDKNDAQTIFSDLHLTDAEQRKGIDAEQAIQKYSKNLHDFLYKQTSGDGHINVSRLHELLTVPMIEEVWALRGMAFAVNPPQKGTSELLGSVFQYETVSRNKQWTYALTKQLKTEVCPYCNRIFTATIMNEERDKFIIRPQIDHFKSKDKYPFFSVSIMNWVPSCGFCNQRKSFKDIEILYPYAEGAGHNYVFRTCYSCTVGPDNRAIYVTGAENAESSFTICGEIDPCIPDEAAYAERLRYIQESGKSEAFSDEERETQKNAYIQRLRGSADLFCWEEACQHHKSYVLRMFRQNYQFGKEYRASLGRSFRDLFLDPTLIYLRDIRKERWGDAPLAKLTHDIDLEIQTYNNGIWY